MSDPFLSASWWGGRYVAGDTGWDLGQVSPPFARLHADGDISPCRVAVPGCGKGWEVTWLAERGYRVTGIDFAPEALAEIKKRVIGGGTVPELLCVDVLSPPDKLTGAFDLVLEQTCFCAIHPDRRADYVTAMHRILKPGGKLVGLFYRCKGEEGPPFSIRPEEVRELFEGAFEIASLDLSAHSHERRLGEEWLGVLVRT